VTFYEVFGQNQLELFNALEAVNHRIPLDMLRLSAVLAVILRELISEPAVWQPTPPQPPPHGIVLGLKSS
jgi:hypothetical protein